MRKTSIVILLLSAAFVTSNAWWLYNAIDFGITHTYAMQACSEDSEALQQALALLPVVATPGVDRESVIATAHSESGYTPFEKDGFTWVGQLGLRFDEDGKLSEVSR